MISLFFLVKPFCKPDQTKVYGVAKREKIHVSCEVVANPSDNLYFNWVFNSSSERLDLQENLISNQGSKSVAEHTPQVRILNIRLTHIVHHTGKSLWEALILASVNPQYDERLFIEFPEKYKFRTCCVQKLFFFVLTFKTIFVHNMLWTCIFLGIQEFSSYCGLTGERMRASEKDLPVHKDQKPPS